MTNEEQIEEQRAKLLEEIAILRVEKQKHYEFGSAMDAKRCSLLDENGELKEENSKYRLQFESNSEHLNELTEKNRELKQTIALLTDNNDSKLELKAELEEYRAGIKEIAECKHCAACWGIAQALNNGKEDER